MNVLVVDDHALIQEGIASIIKAIEPRTRVFLASDCASAMKLAECEAFDLAFLDLQLPDMNGFYALEQLKKLRPFMSIVVVSAQEDKSTVFRAVEKGAKAFVPKSCNADKMRGALEALMSGKIYLPETMYDDAHLASHAKNRLGCHDNAWDLTDRQKEVLVLMIAGLSNKMIAKKLNIVESTVKIHVSAILRELKVATRTQAIIAVARYGIQLPRVLH